MRERIEKQHPTKLESSHAEFGRNKLIFPDGERTSALADEHKLFVDKQLVEPFETAPHKGEIETARIQAERDESFQTRPPFAADRLCEQGKQQIGLNKAGSITPTDEQIAGRAYDLYLDRGQIPGHELEDWLQVGQEFSENWRR
jgi:Protein of unknown function (DUF2934)